MYIEYYEAGFVPVPIRPNSKLPAVKGFNLWAHKGIPRKQVEEFYKERKELNQKFKSKKITLAENLRRVVVNNLAEVLNVSFDELKDVKSIENRKAIWLDVEAIINFSSEVAL